jgi:hypothetical protein
MYRDKKNWAGLVDATTVDVNDKAVDALVTALLAAKTNSKRRPCRC